MIRIRTMVADDLALGMRLKEQAGWNQTEADWRRMLDLQPEGCFVGELDGEPVYDQPMQIWASFGPEKG